MGWKKISIITLLLLFFMLGCNYQKNLKFSTGKCNQGINPYNTTEGLFNHTWVSDNTLVVEGYVNTFCGGAIIKGSYLIEGNDLILEYDIKITGAITLCNCPHKVIYEISELEKKDYNIILRQLAS